MIPFVIRESRTNWRSYLRRRKVIMRGELPTSFEDITTEQLYKLLKTNDGKEQLFILTGIDKEKIERLSDSYVLNTLNWLDYNKLNEYTAPNTLIIKNKLVELFDDLGKYSWGQKIIVQRKLSECKDNQQQLEALPFIVAVYLLPFITGKTFNMDYLQTALKYVDKMPCSIVIPLGNKMTESIVKIVERDNKYLKYSPDKKEILSGINELSKFAEKNTIDALAGGDILKHEQVIKLPYNTIFLKLYQDLIKAKIQKKYVNQK